MSLTQVPPFGQLLGRFALAGVIAGAAAAAFQLLVTERTIAPALALEELRSETGHDHSHEDMFSRTTQEIGGVLGVVIAGVVFAVVVGSVFALVRHRLPGGTDGARTAVLAAVGFGVFALLPALKIPANPPAVGDPVTVGIRTAIYGAVLVCGIVIALAVAALVGALRARGSAGGAVAAAALGLVVVLVTVVMVALPDSPDTISADVPAAVVWNFRLASLGQLAVLWAVLGVAAGWLVDRLTIPSTPSPADVTRGVPA
ncbi:hypothetical protein FDO65_17350 [Nakamurella flava]|uniref:CbtA family protein n=1 Tax=Nakamurella flava TaxID=2576308 RepID=A0A4U6QBN6_9ACTN|nr:CbtA family protein [Nakamurella flava]TKV57296.1 hypothetical protein FDO65_17350 [Nakamurella flava]